MIIFDFQVMFASTISIIPRNWNWDELVMLIMSNLS
jgi:hypothetical protein